MEFVKRLAEVTQWCNEHPIKYESGEQQKMYAELEKLNLQYSHYIGRIESVGHIRYELEELSKRYKSEAEARGRVRR